MKKIILISLATLVAFVSCQKEISDDTTTAIAPQIVTASIDQGDTKVTVDIGTDKAKVNWDADDQIVVTDKNGKLGMYEIESGAGTPRATFKLVENMKEEGFGVAPYTAEYGADFSVTYCEQYFSTAAGATKYLHMTAPSSNDADFSFTAKYGLLKLNLKDGDHTITRVILSGEDTSVLLAGITANTPVDISEGVDFYIALPPGKYTRLEVQSGEWCHAVKTIDFEIAANQVRSAKSASLFFEDFSGLFSVDENKKVRFSPGNLYYDAKGSNYYLFKFEDHQYDVMKEEDLGTGSGHIGLFRWSDDSRVAYSYATYFSYNGLSENDLLFTNATANTAKPDFVVNGRMGVYRALSQAEWLYLLQSRTVNGGKGKDKSYSSPVKYGGISGFVLYPDDYTGPALSGNVSPLPDGVIFFPAAGYLDLERDLYFGYGCGYWTSDTVDSTKAFLIYAPELPSVDFKSQRGLSWSIRLVMDVTD